MSLSVGIVGLPNVGKSTLFNALLKKQAAYVANFPFATIEPNVGVVPVPDCRLIQLSDVVKESEKLDNLPPLVPATVEFVDIAGLIAGAYKGEGLGNKFLSHIRQVSAILHVIRCFTDPEIVKEGSVDPISDFEVVETELMMADYQTLEKQKETKGTFVSHEKARWSVILKLKAAIERGVQARLVELTQEEAKVGQELSLLSMKPILIALNVDERVLKNAQEIEQKYAQAFGVETNQIVAISAKVESELADFSDEEQQEYLADLGITKSGLGRVIKKGFAALGLITFLTAGAKEVRAWTIQQGTNAQNAAGEIHNDFVKNFIKADVIKFEDFVSAAGWKNAREQGLVRSEGREYIVQDGDVIEFKIGT